MKKPVDKTKKSNIKCEHCKWWAGNGAPIVTTTNGEKVVYKGNYCTRADSPKAFDTAHYYNRCKCFEWREDI